MPTLATCPPVYSGSYSICSHCLCTGMHCMGQTAGTKLYLHHWALLCMYHLLAGGFVWAGEAPSAVGLVNLGLRGEGDLLQ